MQTLLSHFLIPGWLSTPENEHDIDCVALLNVIQQSLLQNPAKLGIELAESQLARDCGQSADHQQKSFDSNLRKFSQLRVNLETEKKNSVSIPIVSRITSAQSNQKLMINFEFSPLGAELLLGFHNPFLKLIHEMKDRVKLSTQPVESLFVWKPLWLDLSPKDRKLYLILEQHIQIKQACVHLDGIFAISMRRFLAKSRDFDECLKSLRRMGKKCVDHGLLVADCPADPVLLPQLAELETELDIKPPFVLFQLNCSHPVVDEIFFVNLANRFFSDTVNSPYTEAWLSLTSAGIFRPELERLVSQLKIKMENWTGGFYRFQNWLIDLRLIWIEWFLRSQRGHRFPLPSSILECAPYQLGKETFKNISAGALTFDRAEFENFCQLWIADANSYGFVWLKNSVLSFGDEAILQDVLGVFDQNAIFKPKDLAKDSAVTQAVTDSAKTSTQTTADSTRARLKKIAFEELRTMVRYSLHEYQLLKEKFFKSLTSDQFKLMQNIKLKMQPTLFEQHLEGRIVQFMMEHPDQWTSAKRSSLIENLSNQF